VIGEMSMKEAIGFGYTQVIDRAVDVEEEDVGVKEEGERHSSALLLQSRSSI